MTELAIGDVSIAALLHIERVADPIRTTAIQRQNGLSSNVTMTVSSVLDRRSQRA